MATRKQVVEAMRQYLQEIGSDLLEEEGFDVDKELEFLLGEYLYECDLCSGCRWYFSPERSCEKPNDSIRCCMNRMYKHWTEHRKQHAG